MDSKDNIMLCDRCDCEIEGEPFSNIEYGMLCESCFRYIGSKEEQADLKDKSGESHFEQKTGR